MPKSVERCYQSVSGPKNIFRICDYEEGVALEIHRDGELHARIAFRDEKELQAFVGEIVDMAGEKDIEIQKILPISPQMVERIETQHTKGLTIRSLFGSEVLKKGTAFRMFYAAGGKVTYVFLVKTTNDGLALALQYNEYLTSLVSFEDMTCLQLWLADMQELVLLFEKNDGGVTVQPPLNGG